MTSGFIIKWWTLDTTRVNPHPISHILSPSKIHLNAKKKTACKYASYTSIASFLNLDMGYGKQVLTPQYIKVGFTQPDPTVLRITPASNNSATYQQPQRW